MAAPVKRADGTATILRFASGVVSNRVAGGPAGTGGALTSASATEAPAVVPVPGTAAAAASRLGLTSKTWHEVDTLPRSLRAPFPVRGGRGRGRDHGPVYATGAGAGYRSFSSGHQQQQHQFWRGAPQQPPTATYKENFETTADRGRSWRPPRPWSPAAESSSSSGPEDVGDDAATTTTAEPQLGSLWRSKQHQQLQREPTAGSSRTRARGRAEVVAEEDDDDRPSDLVATWGSGSNSPLPRHPTVGDDMSDLDDDEEEDDEGEAYADIGGHDKLAVSRGRSAGRAIVDGATSSGKRSTSVGTSSARFARQDVRFDQGDRQDEDAGLDDDADERGEDSDADSLSDDTSHVRQRVMVPPPHNQAQRAEQERELLLARRRDNEIFARSAAVRMARVATSKSSAAASKDTAAAVVDKKKSLASTSSDQPAPPAADDGGASRAVPDKKQVAIDRVQQFLQSTPVPSIRSAVPSSSASLLRGVGVGAGTSAVTTPPQQARHRQDLVSLSGGVRGRKGLSHNLDQPPGVPSVVVLGAEHNKVLDKLGLVTVTDHVLGAYSFASPMPSSADHEQQQQQHTSVLLTNPASRLESLSVIVPPAMHYPVLFERGTRSSIDARIMFCTSAPGPDQGATLQWQYMRCATVRLSTCPPHEDCQVLFVPPREQQGLPAELTVHAKLVPNAGNRLGLRATHATAPESFWFLELRVSLGMPNQRDDQSSSLVESKRSGPESLVDFLSWPAAASSPEEVGVAQVPVAVDSAAEVKVQLPVPVAVPVAAAAATATELPPELQRPATDNELTRNDAARAAQDALQSEPPSAAATAAAATVQDQGQPELQPIAGTTQSMSTDQAEAEAAPAPVAATRPQEFETVVSLQATKQEQLQNSTDKPAVATAAAAVPAVGTVDPTTKTQVPPALLAVMWVAHLTVTTVRCLTKS